MTLEYECPNCGTLNVPVNPRTEAIKCRCGKTFVVLDEVDDTLLAELETENVSKTQVNRTTLWEVEGTKTAL